MASCKSRIERSHLYRELLMIKRWILCAGLLISAGAGQAAPETALEMRINAAAWQQSHAVGENKTGATLIALGISDVAFSVMVEDGAAFVAARIETRLPEVEALWLSQTNQLQLESVAAHEYRWIPSVDQKNLKLPAFENLRIRFSGSTVLIADLDHFSLAEAMDATPVGESLLSGSVRISLLFEPLCRIADRIIDAQEEGFGKAMISSMWKSIRTQIESIEDLPVTTVDVVSVGNEGRKMSLQLKCKDAAAAAQMQAFFGKGDDAWKDPAVTEQQLALKKLTHTPHFLESKLVGREVYFFYEWPTAEDSEMLEIIGQAIFGGISPMRGADTFPINPKETIAEPDLRTVDNFDAALFEKDFKAALFFAHAFGRSVDFEVDYLEVPNVELLTAVVTNARVIAAHDQDIAHPARKGSFQYDAKRKSARISLPTDAGESKPERASFTLEFSVPTEVEICSLSAERPVIEWDEKGCCLIAISNSVVHLRSKNLSLRDAEIYARDAAGDYLRHSSSMTSDSNYRATYRGLPASVEVVLPTRIEKLSLEFEDLSVTKESKPVMPSSPTNAIVTRYTLEAPPIFTDPDMAAFSAGTMTYVTNGGWKKNGHELKFQKPEHVEVERIGLRTYLTDTAQFVSQGQRGGHSFSGGFFKWNLDNTNAVKSAGAVFGEIDAEFWSGTGRYTADNLSSNLTALITDRELPAVAVEHNVVWVSVEKEGKVLGVEAFDATGRKLKRDNRTSWSNSKRGYFFWGKPVKVTVDYASEKVSAQVLFQVELKSGGLKGVSALQAKIAAFEELQETLQHVAENCRSSYGTLLAANYYAQNQRKEPIAKIPLDVAQSDPAGAVIFGYELKPYMGYYFKKIQTEREREKELPLEDHEWSGGTFQTRRCNGVYMAVPADPAAPTLLLSWNDLYVNYGDFSTIEAVSTGSNELKKDGWFQVR